MILKPWDTQKMLIEERERIPSYNEIIELFNTIPEERTQALFSLLYLTAGRISEVMSLRRNNFVFTKEKGHDIMLIENMPNRKHHRKKFKDIPIKIAEHEILCECIKDHCKQQEDLIFPFSIRRAEQLLFKYVGMNPHFIRHVRLTHLAKKGFDTIKLLKFAGWTTTDQADTYVEYNWRDLI